MTTARQQILTHLKKVGSASAREIGRALEMSAPNVRHHLSVMCADGRVEALKPRKLYGKGRPEKIYSLSRLALGDNLGGLASALLKQAGPELALEPLAKELAGGGEPAAGLTPARRLSAAVARLNELNYRARWEAGAEGPHIILGLCPYAAIIQEHPELCRLDAALLERLLGNQVEQRSKLAPVCVFGGRQ